MLAFRRKIARGFLGFISLCFIVGLVFNEFMEPCEFSFKRAFEVLSSRINCSSNNKQDHWDVEVIGIDQTGSQDGKDQKYIFVLPRNVKCSSCNLKSCQGVRHLVKILESWKDFDGASCRGNSSRSVKSCRFFTKHWTMIIQEDGKLHTRKLSNDLFSFVNCNMVEGPFVIRRDVFNDIDGFKPSHGDTTLLDFSLRSNGTLKIASSFNCSFTDEQLANDRGAMSSKEIYLDYGRLGFNHNILRVIRRDSIIWTQCTRNEYFCPNKPLQEINNTISRKLSPFCCDVALNRYLIDAVRGLQQAGIDYRVCYGTALGAVRAKNIIPWTRDIGIHVTIKDYRNSYAFDKLKKIMQKLHYSTPLVFQLRRILPLFPLKIDVPNVFSYNLFRNEILEQMQGVLPITKPSWGTQGYVDIYPYKGDMTTPSYLTINGQKYKTHANVKEHIVKAFGNSWREVSYTYNSKGMHTPWVWKLDTSLLQEDKPVATAYCRLYQRVIFIGITIWTCIIFRIAVKVFKGQLLIKR